MGGGDYINWVEWPGQWLGQNDGYTKNMLEQKKPSLLYVDSQVAFWDQIIPKNSWKIYMSDHGHTFFGKFHPFMKIRQENLKPKKCTQLLSYYNFDEIIFKLLKDRTIDNLHINNKYVQIQDVDYYTKEYILHCIQLDSFSPEGFIGYQGVVTEKDILFKTFDGRIYYQKFINDEKMVSDQRLKELEHMISLKQPDIYAEEKFKYSRIYVEAEKKNRVRLKEIIQKKQKILEKLFEEISEDSNLAIRCGGMHTLRMLLMLPEHLRKKVKYIIDRDHDCYAAKLGIKLIDIDDIKQCGVRTIIISTYMFREKINKECSSLPNVKVIDFYDYFENEGIHCDRNFWERNYIKDDFESI